MRYIILILFSIPLFSCKHPQSLTKEELVRYVNDSENGLVKEKIVNGVHVRVKYQPIDFLIEQEIVGQQQASFLDLEKKYARNVYFILELSKDGGEAIRQLGSFSRYSEMLQVLSFQMVQYVNLSNEKRDTIALSDYVFQQNYGMGNANSLMFAFDKERLKGSSEFYFNLSECGFAIGDIEFVFKREDIEDTPRLDSLPRKR